MTDYEGAYKKIAKGKKITPMNYGVDSVPQRDYYPTFSVNLSDIPEAKKWEVGKIYKVQLTVKQTRLEQSENRERVEFEIHKIAAIT